MQIRLGLLTSIALSLTIAPLAVPVNPVTRVILPPAVAQTAEAQMAEADRLINQGIQHLDTSRYREALQSFQQALEIYQQETVRAAFPQQSRNGEAAALGNLGSTYWSLSQYRQAIEYYQQALPIYRAVEDRNGEAKALNNLGNAYWSLSQYQQAIEYYQQALPIYRAVEDRNGEAKALNNLGNAYSSLSQYRQAIEYYQQALPIYRAVEDRNGEARALMNLGSTYWSLSQYRQAIEYYQQALPIFRAVEDRNGEANALNKLGLAYWSLSQYQQAIEYYQQALPIFRAVEDRNGEANALNKLGLAYSSLSQYRQAIEYYQQALPIFQAVEDRNGEAKALLNLGSAYWSLSQYQQAIEYYQQALPIYRAVENRNGEAKALTGLGNAYRSLSQYQQAIEYYQQALPIFQAVKDRNGEAGALTDLGTAYSLLSQYQQAIEYYQQALPIYRAVENRNGEAYALNNLGNAYRLLSQYQQAIEYYQQALPILRAVEDRDGQGTLLANIGKLLEQQNQSELAIVFLKQSVNVRESIRGDIRGLSQELQQSYTNSVASDYRRLADLLLSQGRILEAQQVLDLLKLEELREYTRNARSFETDESIALNAIEQQIIDEYGTIIAFGQKIADCERTNCAQLNSLLTQQRNLTNAYDQRVSELIKTIRDNRQNDNFFYDPTYISETARDIVAEPGTVLIYPFVQDDKLWLIWTAAGDVVGSKAIEVNQQQLGETVVRFRELLQDPQSDLAQLQATGKQLYDWLIQPIKTELEAKGQPITHLVFAQDRILRYVPMAALFDGNQYLIQRYQVSTILSAQLTDMSDRLASGTSSNPVLGLGLTESVNGLNPLPNVKTELDQIVRQADSDPNGIYPGQEFLNQAFNLTALEQNLRNSRIVHIATHGKFVAGLPEQSYLVLGNGDPFPIQQIDRLGSDLRNVNLVVLSACETALGGTNADGIEVAGISAYFLAANRASTVMASLWAVNDGSTSLLMQQFYRNLSSGMGKAKALQQAQLSLLNATNTADSNRTGDATIAVINTETGLPTTASDNPDHPYFWAPFILIGNGL